MLVSNSAFTTRFAPFPDRPNHPPSVCPTGRTHRLPVCYVAWRDIHRSPAGSGRREIAFLSSTIRPAPGLAYRRDQLVCALSLIRMIYDIIIIYQSGQAGNTCQIGLCLSLKTELSCLGGCRFVNLDKDCLNKIPEVIS